jgi:hypothetical protein
MKKKLARIYSAIVLVLCVSIVVQAQQPTTGTKINVGGVFPDLAMVAGHSPRTEAGIGAMVPWANRLWLVTYVAHMKRTGSGTGLYEIDETMTLRKRPESVVGTYANRLIHGPSNQLIIGPHIIDTLGNVRTIDGVKDHRLAATMEHLTDNNKVYFLAMEGQFFEVDVHTLETKELFNLMDELNEPKGSKPHFKSAFTHHGRVVVANNSYNTKDYNGQQRAGRLAEWDGKKWTVLEEFPFTEVFSARAFGQPMFATGWDQKSVILKAFINGAWKTYRLPKSSFAFDETSNTEWMRIREVETERALMDCHGLFYELSYHTYGNSIWGIRPISKHLRVVPDFCSWRGMLVLAGNQSTPMQFQTTNLDRNPLAGQPQAGLWFGKTDDLWSFGKPTGWGGPWHNTQVKAGEHSDPYLMTGFDKKVLHLKNNSNQSVKFTIEVDFIGSEEWTAYQTITVPANGYVHHEFPDGYQAHWVRLVTDRPTSATAIFFYN